VVVRLKHVALQPVGLLEKLTERFFLCDFVLMNQSPRQSVMLQAIPRVTLGQSPGRKNRGQQTTKSLSYSSAGHGIPGSQILAMHLKIYVYSVIVLLSGNTNLLSHKIFRPLRSVVPKMEMTTETVFVLKFNIHFACLNPKLVAFRRGKGC